MLSEIYFKGKTEKHTTTVLKNTAANTMKIPMVVSEQYPKAFLHTVDTLQSSYDIYL